MTSLFIEFKKKKWVYFLIELILAGYVMTGCAANPYVPSPTNTSNSSLISQQSEEEALIGAHINFNFSNFYTLSSPNPATHCAGDVNVYYDPLAVNSSGNPLPLPTSVANSSTTIQPSFIKNISVDITDANAPQSSNNASSCSYGNSSTSPPVTNCATFDYGDVNGIPSTLGGSLVLIGGLSSPNYTGIQSAFTSHGLSVSCGPALNPNQLSAPTGYNNCSGGMYALGVNTLPASAAGTSLAPGLSSASGPISMWSNLSSTAGYSGPQSTGASLAYDGPLNKIVFFGGTSPLSGLGATGSSSYTYDTWIYNLETEDWVKQTANVSVNIDQEITQDYESNSGPTIQLSQGALGRALFGYAAVPGMAINQLSTTGLVSGSTGAGVDTTDRIIIAGGYGPCANNVCSDVHKFNPTYGPEYFDVKSYNSAINTTDGTSALFPTQWISSYYMQLVTNTNANSTYYPSTFPTPNPAPTPSFSPVAVSFGMVGLNNNNPSTTGVGVSSLSQPSSSSSPNTPGAGYVLAVGGFYGYSGSAGAVNTPSGSCKTIYQCGGMQFLFKWFNTQGSGSESTETSASNFGFATNFLDYIGNENTPGRWVNVADESAPSQTPWMGGAVLLKGINVQFSSPSTQPSPPPPSYPTSNPDPSALNQVVYFGGSSCQNYMIDPTTCTNWPSPGNPGRYWMFGIDPSYTFNDSTTSYPYLITMGGTPPGNAGMAAARGLDANGNPVIVAWGGMSKPAIIDSSGTIYYLYNNSGTPTWGSYTPPAGSGPQGLANAAMVFSHVTGNFYLFGGYNPILGTLGDTWQLSINTSNCGVSSSCQFSWTLMNSSSGLTCYPSCPSARRSHRMVEVNYNYFNPPYEPTCSANSPCSFGIFMEGGTTNGIAPYYADRWMFDPTANGGQGSWQQMGDLPPRTLGSMASVDYFASMQNIAVHRMILFGGETGMQDPDVATGQSNGAFVPPTLGDTWMFDPGSSTGSSTGWHRVTLYGQRYSSNAASSFSSLSEIQARAASLDTDTSSQILSPPPTSGGTMVVRTLSRQNHSTSDSPQTLDIPQVFFFGGRNKGGFYNTLNQVYKFCSGSTGEKPYPTSLKGTAVPGPDDASCDAYDPTYNPNSTSPTNDYTGRWLYKAPSGTNGLNPSQLASFMGAGAYDPMHDLVVLYGGLTPSSSVSTTAVTTNSGNRTTLSSSGTIYEYTPPSAVEYGVASSQFNGTWAQVPSCVESVQVPTGRFGHSLSYDPLNQALVLVGGYDVNGNLLTENVTPSGGNTYQIPDVWTANRIDSALPSGLSQKNIPPILLGPFPCYYWSQVTTFGNSLSNPNEVPPLTGLANTANVFIPATGYNTGYYSMFDSSCANSGPISTPDENTNKLLVGGVYFDIDRTQLGPNENLLLNLTFFPLGTSNVDPNNNYLASDETAAFQVHLVQTGQSASALQQVFQPRILTYANTTEYPEIAQNIAVISPPTGQIRQEQIFLPISIDPTIDRIWVERYSGSAILIDATLFRMGWR